MNEIIKFADPTIFVKENSDLIYGAFNSFLNQDEYVLGDLVSNFEKNFATYVGVDYSIGLASGTDAIKIALQSLDIGVGDEVLVPTFTAVATVSAICAAGATPIFLDIESDKFLVDIESIKSKITISCRAIVIVHLYGDPVDMSEIQLIAREFNLYIIEDCAQSTGAIYKDHKVGSIGDIGCFSFYPTKNLGALGDGGMITTNSKNIAEKVIEMRQYGWDFNRICQVRSTVSRLDAIQASILDHCLPTLDQRNFRRREIAEFYNNNLSKQLLKLPKLTDGHVFHLYVIKLLKFQRNIFLKELKEKGIYAGIHYELPAHKHPAFANFAGKYTYPNSELVANQVVSLPMFPELTQNQLMHVVRSINSVLNHGE